MGEPRPELPQPHGAHRRPPRCAPSSSAVIHKKLATTAPSTHAQYGLDMADNDGGISDAPLVPLATGTMESVPRVAFSTLSLQLVDVHKSGALAHVRCLTYYPIQGPLPHRMLTACTRHGVHLVLERKGSPLPALQKETEPQPWLPPIQVQIAEYEVVMCCGFACGCVTSDSRCVWWPPDHQPRRSELQEWLFPVHLETFVTLVELQPWPSWKFSLIVLPILRSLSRFIPGATRVLCVPRPPAKPPEDYDKCILLFVRIQTITPASSPSCVLTTLKLLFETLHLPVRRNCAAPWGNATVNICNLGSVAQKCYISLTLPAEVDICPSYIFMLVIVAARK